MTALRPTDRFAARPLSAPTQLQEGRVALLRDGRDTGVELKGQVLEAALEAPGGWLLFVTHDTPHEEQLDLVLLGADLRVQERASIGGVEAAGLFGDLRTDRDAASFTFIGPGRWRVRVLERPRLRWPVTAPVGVSRPFGLRTRLEIRRLRAG